MTVLQRIKLVEYRWMKQDGSKELSTLFYRSPRLSHC
jgi:hypothetical protein